MGGRGMMSLSFNQKENTTMAKRPKEMEEQEVDEITEQDAPKTTKSIVPAKYAGRYKNGGSDALAEFIKAQCTTKEGFDFSAFFELARKNGLPEDKVAMYEGQVAAKRLGSQGRARMTLRNMLATIARKNGKLTGLDGSEVDVSLPKPALSGAAAKAKEKEEAGAAAF